EIDDTDEIDDTNKIDDANNTDKIDDANTPHITDCIASETIFTPEQISKFHQIYVKKSIDDEEDDKKQNNKEILDKLDEDAQKQKLKIECCKEKCLQKVDHEDAIIRFQNYNQLTYNEKKIFLKGVLASTLRSNVTTKGE